MSSNYALYIKEREGRDIIEDERGFLTYSFHDKGQTCYIVDVYVRPEYRGQHVATEWANQVATLAKLSGATQLLGSVDPKTSGADRNRQVLEAYGMHFLKKDRIEYYLKEL